MRKNPYIKNLKDRLPLFMQGPSMATALITNEEQKVFLEESMVPPLHKYEAKGVSFTMVQSPFMNPNGTVNPIDILKTEMGQAEVTQKLFETVMGWNDSRFRDPKNPVECVTWYDCIAFCNKLSEILGLKSCYKMSSIQIGGPYSRNNMISAKVEWDETANGFRLPTEYEWELFAKASTQNQWAGTNVNSELKQYAWYLVNSERKTHPVGDKLPNEWGLYDMTGNVLEWCWDMYDPSDGEERVLRGGCCWSTADRCKIASRSGFGAIADRQNEDWGFRICRTIK